MAKDPAFLFYPNDWLGGTMGMTFEEKGAYMELLMLQFNRGHMTKDMIARTVGQLWVNIQDKFIEDEKGLFYNERLEEEQNKRKSFTESRRNNRKGVNQYTKKKPKNSGHMTSHMENEDVNENIDVEEDSILESFNKFWELYGNKQDKVKCQREWSEIDKAEYSKILDHVPKFVKASGEYLCKPINYLQGRRWQDEQLPNYNKNPNEKPKERFIPTPPKLY